MNGLSEKTWEIVQCLFPPELQPHARDILSEECGNNLPFCEAEDEHKLERVRFAALKLSEGNLNQLRSAVEHAKVDGRDVLMWAGFGHSVTAHKEWAQLIKGAS